jgi:hypothetical protein
MKTEEDQGKTATYFASGQNHVHAQQNLRLKLLLQLQQPLQNDNNYSWQNQ